MKQSPLPIYFRPFRGAQCHSIFNDLLRAHLVRGWYFFPIKETRTEKCGWRPCWDLHVDSCCLDVFLFHPRKRTSGSRKNGPFPLEFRRFLFLETSIFRLHVSFRGCMFWLFIHWFYIRVFPFVWPISFHLLQKNSTFLQSHDLLKLDIFSGRYTSFIYHENPQPSCLGVINHIFGGADNLHSFEFWSIFTSIWMVDFYGKLAGKYISPMDPMGVYIRGEINVALGSFFFRSHVFSHKMGQHPTTSHDFAGIQSPNIRWWLGCIITSSKQGI